MVRYDVGFAPNPFHGWCTLATCKPGIRRGASIGDWIAGIGSRQKHIDDRLIYAMRVDEKMSFDEYWRDPRFQRKKPDVRGSLKYRYGDNIYHRNAAGTWEQSNSRHSLDTGAPNPQHVARDTSADAVLLSTLFTYWGGDGRIVPDPFRDWDGIDLCRPGRNYQWTRYPVEMREAFAAWIETLTPGCQGEPADW